VVCAEVVLTPNLGARGAVGWEVPLPRRPPEPLCAALFGFQLSKPAEEIGRHLAGESRAQPIGLLVGLLGIAVGFMIFAQIAKRD
jgi:hypothetical protein